MNTSKNKKIVSKNAESLLMSFKKGYRVTSEGTLLNPNNKFIKGGFDKYGYKVFSIRISLKSSRKVHFHRLQGYQKYGDSIFEKGLELRHLNSNKIDNSFENISLGTHSENMMDMDQSIRLKKSIHAASFIKKYNKNEIVIFYQKHKSYKKTMLHFNISSKSTLHYIINN